MTAPPVFPSFDGLLTLARRDGVDIRPTLLRVLTDLYVQTPLHSSDEERQFVELAARLIDEVDDATRASVSARLAIYPRAPAAILKKLAITAAASAAASETDDRATADETPAPVIDSPPLAPRAFADAFLTSARSPEAHVLNDLFFNADAIERSKILRNLERCGIPPAARFDAARAEAMAERLETAALAADTAAFAAEVSTRFILSKLQAERIATDPSGEPLVVVARAIAMREAAFQRVLLFLNPAIGRSVERVYDLTKLFEETSERAALIMLALWRGAIVHTARAKHQPLLHDDETRRARTAQASPRPGARTPLDALNARVTSTRR